MSGAANMANDDAKESSLQGRDGQTLSLYWQTQWDRIAQLENQRLQVSSYIVAASAVAIGLLAASEGLPSSRVALVAAAVVISNLLAARHSARSAE